MKLTKSKLKQIIKEELAGDDRWDSMDDLRQKFADAIAISLSKGLTADDVRETFETALEIVTTQGRDMRRP